MTLDELQRLSDEQLNIEVAKAMGYRVLPQPKGWSTHLIVEDATGYVRALWNPLTDWNHTREIETRIMLDERLTHRYWDAVMAQYSDTCPIPRLVFIFANQRTRCLAALLALQS
jgi:hypothetical protein